MIVPRRADWYIRAQRRGRRAASATRALGGRGQCRQEEGPKRRFRLYCSQQLKESGGKRKQTLLAVRLGSTSPWLRRPRNIYGNTKHPKTRIYTARLSPAGAGPSNEAAETLQVQSGVLLSTSPRRRDTPTRSTAVLTEAEVDVFNAQTSSSLETVAMSLWSEPGDARSRWTRRPRTPWWAES